jgi:hypothetical protein
MAPLHGAARAAHPAPKPRAATKRPAVPLHWHGHARRKDNAAVAPDALAGQPGIEDGPGGG